MFHKKLKTKSVIIGRRKRIKKPQKDSDLRDCFVDLFDINNPHKTCKAPKKIFEFNKKQKIVISGSKEINFLLLGHDIVINNLKEVEIKEEGPHLHVKGK